MRGYVAARLNEDHLRAGRAKSPTRADTLTWMSVVACSRASNLLSCAQIAMLHQWIEKGSGMVLVAESEVGVALYTSLAHAYGTPRARGAGVVFAPTIGSTTVSSSATRRIPAIAKNVALGG